jgi:hypothetical protein
MPYMTPLPFFVLPLAEGNSRRVKQPWVSLSRLIWQTEPLRVEVDKREDRTIGGGYGEASAALHSLPILMRQ